MARLLPEKSREMEMRELTEGVTGMSDLDVELYGDLGSFWSFKPRGKCYMSWKHYCYYDGKFWDLGRNEPSQAGGELKERQRVPGCLWATFAFGPSHCEKLQKIRIWQP